MLDFVAAPSTSLVDAARTAAPAAELLPIARSRSTGGIVSTLDWVRIAVLSARGGLSGRGSRRAPLSLTLRLSSVPRGQSTSRERCRRMVCRPLGPRLGALGVRLRGDVRTVVCGGCGGTPLAGRSWAGVKHLTIIIIAPYHLSCADTGPRAPTSVERTSTVWLQVGLGARETSMRSLWDARRAQQATRRLSLSPPQASD